VIFTILLRIRVCFAAALVNAFLCHIDGLISVPFNQLLGDVLILNCEIDKAQMNNSTCSCFCEEHTRNQKVTISAGGELAESQCGRLQYFAELGTLGEHGPL
jgi:hypothetical protein